MPEPRPLLVLSMAEQNVAPFFPRPVMDRIRSAAEVRDGVITDWADAGDLSEIEVVVTGWGTPRLTEAVIDRMPRLSAVLHAGGGIGAMLPRSFWDRGVVSTAGLANARPVAEFTVAQIVLAGKGAPWAARELAVRQEHVDREAELGGIGNNGRTVGLVGASRIGRLVIGLLRAYDLEVLVSDPYLSEADAAELGVERVGLHELARRSSVLSVHAPATPETDGLVSAAVLAALPDGATVINTARGALLDHEALLAELDAGRLYAMLDVTEPEPLPKGHPLYTHPRAVLTPHLAGSAGNELERLGASVAGELERLVAGLPLAFPARREEAAG